MCEHGEARIAEKREGQMPRADLETLCPATDKTQKHTIGQTAPIHSAIHMREQEQAERADHDFDSMGPVLWPPGMMSRAASPSGSLLARKSDTSATARVVAKHPAHGPHGLLSTSVDRSPRPRLALRRTRCLRCGHRRRICMTPAFSQCSRRQEGAGRVCGGDGVWDFRWAAGRDHRWAG